MGTFSPLHRQLYRDIRLHHQDTRFQPLDGSRPQTKSEQLHPLEPIHLQQHTLKKHRPSVKPLLQQPLQRQKLQPLDPNRLLKPQASPFSLHRFAERFSAFKMVFQSNVARAVAAKANTLANPDEAYTYSPPSDDDELWKPSPPASLKLKKVAPRAKPAPKLKPAPVTTITPRPTPRPRKKRNSDAFSTYSDSSGSGSSRSHSPHRSFSSPLSHVIDGRVTKNYKPRTPRPSTGATTANGDSPAKRLGSTPVVDELVSEINRDNQIDEARCEQDMAIEKALYPGSDAWADEEERLFEALFMRQYRPTLPQSWTFDLRGIPAPDAIFGRSSTDEPLIYSCSGDDYQAGRALVRLIQLTGTIRALVQSGGRAKAAATIRAELFRYANWAAKDGGFSQHAVVPTFLLEVVDTSLGGGEVTNHIKTRMAELAEQHRTFLRRDPGEIAEDDVDLDPVDRQFRRRPPVLYGLFIVHTVVLILTVDSAKPPEEAQISYHVEVNFNSPYQGVWNALTVAIPVCMARDDMRKRLQDFPLLGPVNESDPDA